MGNSSLVLLPMPIIHHSLICRSCQLIWLILPRVYKFKVRVCTTLLTSVWPGELLVRRRVRCLMGLFLVVWIMGHLLYGIRRKWSALIVILLKPTSMIKTHSFTLSKLKKMAILSCVHSGIHWSLTILPMVQLHSSYSMLLKIYHHQIS